MLELTYLMLFFFLKAGLRQLQCKALLYLFLGFCPLISICSIPLPALSHQYFLLRAGEVVNEQQIYNFSCKVKTGEIHNLEGG